MKSVCAGGKERQMYGTDTAAEAVQSFAYEKREDSAVIWRCFSHDSIVEIPVQIDGCPVTEIAPYAFSAHMDEQGLRQRMEQKELLVWTPAAVSVRTETLKPLCGGMLEEIVLPETVKKVGAYCFYDCGSLGRITFSGALCDWGRGVFTRCHRVHSLRVYTDAEGKSYLKDVLDELPEEVRVDYYCPGEDGGTALARLIFPEFYEEGVENTPARILETHVHGSGLSYRNCFQNRRIDFAQYDALFPYAKAWEGSGLSASLAVGRLRFPVGLREKAGEQYGQYVAENSAQIAAGFLGDRDLEGLRWLLGADFWNEKREERAKLLEDLAQKAAGMNYPEAAGYLMNCRRAEKRAPLRRLEL